MEWYVTRQASRPLRAGDKVRSPWEPDKIGVIGTAPPKMQRKRMWFPVYFPITDEEMAIAKKQLRPMNMHMTEAEWERHWERTYPPGRTNLKWLPEYALKPLEE